MKRILAFMLAAMLLLALAGCKDGGAEVVTPTVSNDEMVERTLDAIYVTADTHGFIGSEYAAANGFESAVLNEDNTVTLVMTGERYNELLQEVADALKKEVAQTPTYEDCQHIKEITHNSDFSEITIRVVLQSFDAEGDYVAEYLASGASLYRALQGKDPSVTVITVDANGTQLSVATHPIAE